MLCSFMMSCATNSFLLGSGHSVCSSSKKGSNRCPEKPVALKEAGEPYSHIKEHSVRNSPSNSPTGWQGCWASCLLSSALAPGIGLPLWHWVKLLCGGEGAAGRSCLAMASLHQLASAGTHCPGCTAHWLAFLAVSHSSWDQHGSPLIAGLTSLCYATYLTGAVLLGISWNGGWSPGSLCPSLCSKG